MISPGSLQMIFDAEARPELWLIIYDPQQLRNVQRKWSITFFGPASQASHSFPLFKARNEAKLVFWPKHLNAGLSETDIPSAGPDDQLQVRKSELILTPRCHTALISIFVHFSGPRGSQSIFCKRVDVVYRSAIIIPSTNQRGHYRHIVLRSSSEKDWKED